MSQNRFDDRVTGKQTIAGNQPIEGAAKRIDPPTACAGWCRSTEGQAFYTRQGIHGVGAVRRRGCIYELTDPAGGGGGVPALVLVRIDLGEDVNEDGR